MTLTARSYKIVASLFILYLGSQLVLADSNVRILNYYPSCDYQVLDETSVSTLTETPMDEESTYKLLTRLQKKANSAGAEAIILTDRTLVEGTPNKRLVNRSDSKTFRYGFKAELILLCENKMAMSSKPTPYNDRGDKIGKVLDFGVIRSEMVIDLSKHVVRREKHKITDSNISDSGTVYGVPLLTHFDDVVAVFGDPNSELYLSPDIKIIGYGRNHWLEFEADKLMRVYTEQPLFTVTGFNFIPLIDFYDDNKWIINNEHGFKSSPVKQRVKRPSYVIKKADNQLTLKLDTVSNPVLTGFDLAAVQYQRPVVKAPESSSVLLTKDILSTLGNDELALEERLQTLGQINGVIYDKYSLRKFLIGNNMVVSVRNKTIRTIEIAENIFSSSSKNPNWQVFNFTNGETYDAVLEKLSTDAIDTGYDVFVTHDDYQLTLRFFDQGDDKVLYNAVIAL